jgi:hypothetical protein
LPCSFGLISRISSHPAVFFSHNKPANSAFSTINQRNEQANSMRIDRRVDAWSWSDQAASGRPLLCSRNVDGGHVVTGRSRGFVPCRLALAWRLFSWQKFWRNAIVAVSLLFGKYCPIIV